MTDDINDKVVTEGGNSDTSPNLSFTSPSASTLIEQAQQAANRIKEQNDRFEALIKRQEEARAKQLLGGQSDAGQQPAPAKVETAKEYAERVLSNKIIEK